MGVQGSRGCCFYSPGLGLGVRATPERRALHPDSGRVRVLLEVRDDERVPRIGERRREGKGDGLGRERKWAGARKMGRGKGFLGRGKRKREIKQKKNGGPGWK